MQPFLHVPTLYAVLGTVFLAMALAGVFVRRTSGHVTGLSRLSAGAAFAMAGAVAQSGLAWPGVGATLGNVLFAVGIALLISGMRGFYGLSDRDPLIWLGVGCVAVAAAWFSVVVPSMRARVLVVNGVFSALLLRGGWVALHQGRRVDGAPAVLAALCLFSLSAAALGRAAHALLAPDTDVLGRDAVTALYLVLAAAAAVGFMLGIVSGVNQRLLRASQRARDALERVVEVTAHELRSPLTSIMGALEVVNATGSRATDPAGLVPIALRNAERMRRLIDELLDLETLEAGKAKLCFEAVDVEPFAQQVAELNQPYAGRFGVRLVTFHDARVGRVRADPVRLTQVLTNLVTNAIKHSPPDADVRLAALPCPLGVRFEVADSGSGVPAELRDSLFERFARGAERHRGVESTGLGLAIAKSIVEASGGRIGFDSVPGQGSVFHVELPEA